MNNEQFGCLLTFHTAIVTDIKIEITFSRPCLVQVEQTLLHCLSHLNFRFMDEFCIFIRDEIGTGKVILLTDKLRESTHPPPIWNIFCWYVLIFPHTSSVKWASC